MQIGEFQMESPLMNGGGLVKTVEDVHLMAGTAVGAILAGSFTLEPRVGNSPHGETVYYYDPTTGITYNALGMPNRGMEYVADNLKHMMDIAHESGKPLILNFAPVTDNPVDEVIGMAALLESAGIEEIDALELNASCPNVVTADGGRHELLSHHPQRLGEVLLELSDISANEIGIGKIFTRIAPFRAKSDALEIARVAHEIGIDGVAAFNTFMGGVPLGEAGLPILQVPGNAGGRSGRGMRLAAATQTRWLIEARDAVLHDAGRTFDILGSNGIYNGESMYTRMHMGVAAVSATTAFWEAHSWGEAADTILREYADLASPDYSDL